MWELLGSLLRILLAAYALAVLFRWTCIKHSWEEHGPTAHMAHDIETDKIIGWKRMWWVCSRCGAKHHGRKMEE